jgi:ribonuclease P protein component
MQTFKKAERLCNRTLINALFKEGRSFNIYPVRVSWMDIDPGTPSPAEVLIIVSRKKFSKATERNRIKRRIREAYRKNKSLFYECLIKNEKKCVCSLNYYGTSIIPSKDVERIIMLILQRLIREYEKSSG